MMPKEKLMTTDELSQYLKVPKSWVYAKTRQGAEKRIPHLRVGKYIRFYLQDVLDWLQHQN